MLIQDNILPVGPRHNYEMSGKFAAVTFGAYFAGRSILRMLRDAYAKRASAASTSKVRECLMPTYFDMKDGAPIRDRVGLEFPTDLHAIEHSKKIARRLSHEHPVKDRNLCIMVLSESGTEIHREPVYPGIR